MRAEEVSGLDNEVLCVDRATFERLQELEKAHWWPEHDRYYMALKERAALRYRRAGLWYITPSNEISSACRLAAERAAHRKVLEIDGRMPGDWELVNGVPTCVTPFHELCPELLDVDNLVNKGIHMLITNNDEPEDE